MRWLFLILGWIPFLLCGCSLAPSKIQVPTITETGVLIIPSPVNTVGSIQTNISGTATPSPAPKLQICSPLEGISSDQLTNMIANSYNPPPPGSDEPHAGIDLADVLPDTQIAISGRCIQAAMSGVVAAVISDRFPYGNAVMIETRRADLPAEITTALDLPDTPNEPVRPISLTCPEKMTWYDDTAQSLYILYAHMEQSSSLQVGDAVFCGQHLGTLGMSGNALNPHLHFELRVGPSGAQFSSMAHYDASASPEEIDAYCVWSVGGQFHPLNPIILFTTRP